MKTKLLILALVATFATQAIAQTFGFVSLGISDLGKIGTQEGKSAKTVYVGIGQERSQTLSLFGTGGYSKHGFETGDNEVATGEITGGFAYTPICIPRVNPLIKIGFVGQGGVGLIDMSEGDAINSSIALIGGLIGTYAFSVDAQGKPVGKVEAHIRIVDTGDFEKVEIGVGLVWAFAQATK